MAVARTILLQDCNARRYEGTAGAAITPGHLITKNSAGNLVVHPTAGGKAAPIFAAENELFGDTISDAYAADDNVLGWVCPPGAEVYALVPAAAAAIVIGDQLESNGDGTLRKETSSAVSVSTGGVVDDDSAASNGVALYLHVDDIAYSALPVGHLESVTAGDADTYFDVGASGGRVRVEDDDAAATGGLQVYFDEDATAADSRFLVNNTVTGKDVFVFNSDGEAIRFKHDASASTNGVAVYLDDDATDEEDRLLFVSPTDTDGTYQTDDSVGWKTSPAFPIAMALEAVDNSGGSAAARIRVMII